MLLIHKVRHTSFATNQWQNYIFGSPVAPRTALAAVWKERFVDTYFTNEQTTFVLTRATDLLKTGIVTDVTKPKPYKTMHLGLNTFRNIIQIFTQAQNTISENYRKVSNAHN